MIGKTRVELIVTNSVAVEQIGVQLITTFLIKDADKSASCRDLLRPLWNQRCVNWLGF